MNSSPPPRQSASLEWAPIHQAVQAWYATHGRDLPWRRANDPYAILVSEVMLQQTQVDRTIPKYLDFLDRFPSIEALANAPIAEVIRYWSGMGYNNRAVRLHRLAVEVVTERGGQLPSTVKELMTLPGLGPYTAAAVACFAFGASVPVLDTNIYRVLSRLLYGITPASKRTLETEATIAMPNAPWGASRWSQALMDIGATLCMVAKPRCMLCPLRPHCAAAEALQGGDARVLAESSVPYSPKQSKFAGSTRYYRGRIIEALRNVPAGTRLSYDNLGSLVRENYDSATHQSWLVTLIDGLVRDGLAQTVFSEDGRPAVCLP